MIAAAIRRLLVAGDGIEEDAFAIATEAEGEDRRRNLQCRDLGEVTVEDFQRLAEVGHRNGPQRREVCRVADRALRQPLVGRVRGNGGAPARHRKLDADATGAAHREFRRCRPMAALADRPAAEAPVLVGLVDDELLDQAEAARRHLGEEGLALGLGIARHAEAGKIEDQLVEGGRGRDHGALVLRTVGARDVGRDADVELAWHEVGVAEDFGKKSFDQTQALAQGRVGAGLLAGVPAAAGVTGGVALVGRDVEAEAGKQDGKAAPAAADLDDVSRGDRVTLGDRGRQRQLVGFERRMVHQLAEIELVGGQPGVPRSHPSPVQAGQL
ncbi:hypothetical protein [Reyranella soli]|uniref:hypothetical protein n=1 Tax=Reyranella soli TaxID=1230389 RepID=UPI0014784A6F